MVDTALHPSRRTIVKAGLWAAPALAVVNLTSMSAAQASISGCTTTYPSHGILVYTATKTGSDTYYVFKFGDGTSTPPTAGPDQDPNDIAYLQGRYPTKTLIGSGKAGSVWATIQSTITVALYANGADTGYIWTGPLTGFVAAYVFDGSTGYLPVQPNTDGQYLFTKCA